MLSTLIATLQSGLAASRTYFYGSLLPLALLFLSSVAIGATTFPRVHNFLAEVAAEKPASSALWSSLILLVGAYLLSVLNNPVRRLLETGSLLMPHLRDACLRHQIRLGAKARQNLEENQRHYSELTEPDWMGQLRKARQEGSSKAPPAQIPKALKDAVQALCRRKDKLDQLTLSDFGNHLEDLKSLLRSSSADKKNDDASRDLSNVHTEMANLLDYAARNLQTRRLKAFESFAAFSDTIAPTRMGNIAETLRSYAHSRYGMRLDIVWTRFQRVVQDDEKLNNTLQDAKVQLDFLVSLTWLAAIFVLSWTVILALWSQSLGVFLALALAGPSAVYLLYRLACQAYRTFSEVMRSAVDLRRLDLFGALKMPLPAFPEQEKDAWDRIAEWLGSGNAPDGAFFHQKS